MFGLNDTTLAIGAMGLLIAATLTFSAVWTLLGPLRSRAKADGRIVGLDLETLGASAELWVKSSR